jgi:erythronate-4-phosphate dehydrogenase
MKIVFDQNIPLVDKLFADLGTLVPLPGRKIKPEHLEAATALLVRSVTTVDESLLANSPVTFVGSCTIGSDHLDVGYLEQRGIDWATAPGCNAGAVVQYVLSAMAATQPDWLGKTVGIIGCGNIGGRLFKILEQLGVRCVCYDPVLSSTACFPWVSFAEVLAADIVTCHVPLNKQGAFPTYHMLNANSLSKLNADALLINTSRGAVIDNSALLQQLQQRPDLRVVLDVWENEPSIEESLLERVSIATPHIAGYSLDGKERGTWMIYRALMKHCGMIVNKTEEDVLTQGHSAITISTDWHLLAPQQQLNHLLLSCYDIMGDDRELRPYRQRHKKLSEHFDNMRQYYPIRREYRHFVALEQNFPNKAKQRSLQKWLQILSQR